uniref:DOMON domain-containing protein n=1 Tax=Bionectria ochroleuca TaxID=29856 RepID=A0A8H7NQA9_BIOOC
MNTNKFWFLVTLGVCQVSSSPISFCPDDSDICFKWAVPEVGNENIYFQIDAPTSYQWIGLGIGKQMAGAAMFLVYEDGQGNVTVSNRNGKGHSMPLLGDQDRISLLDGSGVKDGRMIANVLYKNSGNLDPSGSSDWIMAKKQGVSLASVDPDESIAVHDSHSAFSINLAQASVPLDSNPFSENNDNRNDVSGGDATGVIETNSNPNNNLILAHGVILTVVFVAVYPLGSLLMPWLGKWYTHAAWQMVGFLAMWAGFGIGYVVSSDLDIFFDQAHTRLGVVVVALLGMQPILGLLHHMQYRRKGMRGAFGHVHIWYGRALIIMGMVNGGLGLQLTGASDVYIIVYSVVAGVSALLYAAYSTVKAIKTEKKK